jgi:hypothetical protein
MLERMSGFPPEVVAVRGTGRITGDDYRAVLLPAIEEAAGGGRGLRLLLDLGDGFDGYDPSALLADTSLGASHFGDFERIAVVTDMDWVRRAVHLFGPLIPGEVRVHPVAASDEARAWITG